MEEQLITDKDELWASAIEIIKQEIGTTKFYNSFSRLMPQNLGNDVFTIAAPNKFNKHWLERNYIDLLTEVVTQISNRELSVEVVIDEHLVEEQLTSNAPEVNRIISKEIPKEKKLEKGKFDTKYTFDSFIAGSTNSFARDAALVVAEQPGLKYNPLFIWGGAGLGKTHLLHAIGNYVNEVFPQKKVIYATSEEFFNDFTRAIREKNVNSFHNVYRHVDVLLIDDIQFMVGKEGCIEQFFHTFNQLKDNGKQIVIASDRAAGEINMDERMVSRFAQGLQADIQPPTFEVRYAILQQFIENQRIPVDKEAITYIAEKTSSNIREMEGAITRVIAFAELTRNEYVDLELVKKVTDGYFKAPANKIIKIATIQSEVCKFYGINHNELVGSKRTQMLVFPRHVAMYLAQELTDNSLPRIGKEFGGRDHTTVMHAASKIKKLMGSDPEVYTQVEHLTNQIKH